MGNLRYRYGNRILANRLLSFSMLSHRQARIGFMTDINRLTVVKLCCFMEIIWSILGKFENFSLSEISSVLLNLSSSSSHWNFSQDCKYLSFMELFNPVQSILVGSNLGRLRHAKMCLLVVERANIFLCISMQHPINNISWQELQQRMIFPTNESS